MEDTKKCEDCNGLGLVSTGANPLDLNHGNKVVCKSCTGSGKVASDYVFGNPSSTPTGDTADAPKAEGSPENQATGETSGEPSAIGPKLGDPCRMDDDSAGVLAKTEKGNWVCVPKG